MCCKSFRYSLLCLLLITSSCATAENPPVKLNIATPPMPRAEVYYEYLLAQHYLRVNQIEQAIEAYTRALQLDPDSPQDEGSGIRGCYKQEKFTLEPA